eukprot:1762809-Rhodomonas_salina.2
MCKHRAKSCTDVGHGVRAANGKRVRGSVEGSSRRAPPLLPLGYPPVPAYALATRCPILT